MRTIRIFFALAVLASLATAGCNTTEGLGKDIESGGKALKDSAHDHND